MHVVQHLPCVQRSTGCTEPAAVALAAALAARAAGGAPRAIRVACDPGTLRNGLRAGVPGAGGRAGLPLAAALGALVGAPHRRLDVLAGVTAPDVERALDLVAAGAVTITERPADGLWVEATVETDGTRTSARLEGAHDRVVALTRDGRPLPLPWAPPAAEVDRPPASLDEALALADALDEDDAAALLAGMETNLAAALFAGRGPAAASVPPEDDAELLASAAALARMSGAQVTVVTSGWSGNQGLVATLPLEAVARRVGSTRADLARALATSHLVARLLRDRAPSPLCHALVAASAGAAAGCARLLGGGRDEVERAAHLVLAAAGAAACDGAKPACALRVGLAAAQAVRCARRALTAPELDLRGELVQDTLEGTARALAAAADRLRLGGLPCGA
ncbi:MAG: L-serine ammonia-lyase, iron-sulfur-dependent, subunit alpha [Planctomycetes bacterium]|nr:L-serine ammonia-lyase, iron-sulfur-dependent, subunit alpha [Planctomycetota bacterium]